MILAQNFSKGMHFCRDQSRLRSNRFHTEEDATYIPSVLSNNIHNPYIQRESHYFVLYCTGVRIWIEPPRNRAVIEGMNSTVEYCVVIAEPGMAAPIKRSGFSVCVSTVEGTATGKSNNCISHRLHTSIGTIGYMI